MRVVVATPPEPVVTWADADAHLNLGGDVSQKTYVDGLIAAATANIDGPAGWLGRAIGVQTVDAWFDDFGAGPIRLPYPPTIEVVEVAYVAADGTASTMAPGAWTLRGSILDSQYGMAWPATRYQPEAVRVRYKAGYLAVPPAIKAAILLMVGALYADREAAGEPMGAAAALLGPYRVFA